MVVRVVIAVFAAAATSADCSVVEEIAASAVVFAVYSATFANAIAAVVVEARARLRKRMALSAAALLIATPYIESKFRAKADALALNLL